MKILILALPRTGSTSLLDKISKEYNLKKVFEPFHPTTQNGWNRYDSTEDNIIVKSIVCHHSDNLKLIKDFDEIILLSRKNFNDHLESHSYHVYFANTNGYYHINPYIYKEPPTHIIELCKSDLIDMNNELEKISKITNIPIVYYEDLFDLNSEYRLRLKPDKIKII